MSNEAFVPPTGPPPPGPLNLPYISPEERRRFATRGWASINLTDRTIRTPSFDADKFESAFTTLFHASSSFFALPLEYKARFERANEGSEDGWSRVEGEKELVTIRTAPSCPPEVREQVQYCWNICGQIMLDVIEEISDSLGLARDVFRGMVEPCARLPASEQRVATLLRMFRYERGAGRPLGDHPELHHRRVVAERHRDLGLLSLVVGSSPGLEVWDHYTNTWYPIEEQTASGTNGLTATILAGETLARLTNFSYQSGGHRVVVSDRDAGSYRFSVVFALRAHHPVIIDTDHLTTAVTGPFSNPMKGTTAGQLYHQISNSHFNINIGLKERREQEERLRLIKENGVAGEPRGTAVSV